MQLVNVLFPEKMLSFISLNLVFLHINSALHAKLNGINYDSVGYSGVSLVHFVRFCTLHIHYISVWEIIYRNCFIHREGDR